MTLAGVCALLDEALTDAAFLHRLLALAGEGRLGDDCTACLSVAAEKGARLRHCLETLREGLATEIAPALLCPG